MKRLRTLVAVAAFSLVAATMTSAAILPPNDRGHDDLAKWAKKFFVFDAAIPVVNGSHPALDEGDVDCSLGQHGKTWFLETAPGLDGDFERRCSVPEGTRLYVPVFQWLCSPDLDGQEVSDCLLDADDTFGVIDLTVSVDGVVLDDAALEQYRAATGSFELPLVEDSYWEFVTGLELGESIEFGADAYGVLVDQLAAGQHVIRVSATSTEFEFDGSLTYTITVEPKKKDK